MLRIKVISTEESSRYEMCSNWQSIKPVLESAVLHNSTNVPAEDLKSQKSDQLLSQQQYQRKSK